MDVEPTVKKRPNCADGTCPPKRAVHAKGCERRAQQIVNEDAAQFTHAPWTPKEPYDAFPETAENFTIPCCVDGEPGDVDPAWIANAKAVLAKAGPPVIATSEAEPSTMPTGHDDAIARPWWKLWR
jgi:hypothetical protein